MKIGLIARAEYARGLAIQSKNFYDHMPVDRVLLVHMPNPDCALADGWYQNATVVPSLPGHTLDEQIVREWMDGLDVIFTVETPYDWSLPRWAREMGVKTVIQGNPEFVRHGQPAYSHFEHPDAWWWPTSWRLDLLPPGRVVPVPMPDRPFTAAKELDGPLKVFHVVGKRAFADRNGTEVVINALRSLRTDVEVTLFGLDHSLPPIERVRGLTVNVRNEGVQDRWDMYSGQHLLVLPRRYGGLCLPALEAAASGCAVMMPDTSPNEELAGIRVPTRGTRTISVAAGNLQTADLHFTDLAMEINCWADNRLALAEHQEAAYDHTPRWSTYRDIYMEEFARLL